MCLWSTLGFFETFVTTIWNGVSVQTSYILCLGSTYCRDFAFCICSIVIRTHLHLMTTFIDSNSSGLVMRIATQVSAGLFCSSIGASCGNIVYYWPLQFCYQHRNWVRMFRHYPTFQGNSSWKAFVKIHHSKIDIYCQGSDDTEADFNLEVSYPYNKLNYAFDVNCLFCQRSKFPRFRTIIAPFVLPFQRILTNSISPSFVVTRQFVGCCPVFIRLILIRTS